MSASEQQPAADSDCERRIAFRFPCTLHVLYASAAEGEQEPSNPIASEAHDLSTDGIGIVMTQQIPLGTMLHVKLENQNHSFAITTQARVARMIPLPDEKWLAGCIFVDLLSDREMLNLLQE